MLQTEQEQDSAVIKLQFETDLPFPAVSCCYGNNKHLSEDDSRRVNPKHVWAVYLGIVFVFGYNDMVTPKPEPVNDSLSFVCRYISCTFSPAEIEHHGRISVQILFHLMF